MANIRPRMANKNTEGRFYCVISWHNRKSGEPVLIPEPWLEDVVIQWPIAMDLPQANKLKEEAGYTNPYGAVTLRNPLGPTLGNPYFIFGGNPAEAYIFVDTVTGKVHPGR